MIDPQNIVRDYKSYELPDLLAFCVCVAGKKSSIIAPRIEIVKREVMRLKNLFNNWDDGRHWLNICHYVPTSTLRILRDSGIGCATQKQKALCGAGEKFSTLLALRTASIEDLESIPFIGPKTSRFYRMCFDPNAKYAALDTHILKWMRAQGIDCPKSTPTGKQYLELERKFLSLVPEGKTPAEFDLEIWRQYSNPPA